MVTHPSDDIVAKKSGTDPILVLYDKHHIGWLHRLGSSDAILRTQTARQLQFHTIYSAMKNRQTDDFWTTTWYILTAYSLQ
jgi:hypothetical protein